jgi:hypothetical protein
MRYEPDWKPLERVLSETECGDFMYMAHVGTIALYKHWGYRRYLNIDAETGRFYQYANDDYVEISREDALNWVRCIFIAH